MWVVDLIGILFGLIIVFFLFGILALLVCGVIYFVGFFIEEVNDKDKGFFHKVAEKLDLLL